MNVLSQRLAVPVDEAALAARLLEGFRALSLDPLGGVTRPAWSALETACHALWAAAGEAQGLARHVDAVGNTWLASPGLGDAPAMATGSHLDSVPQGGNFDGAAGTVAGWHRNWGSIVFPALIYS